MLTDVGGDHDYGDSVVVQSDGKVIVGGWSRVSNDGFTNAQEYAAGTNPTLSGDFFKAANVTHAGNTFSVSTAGKAGRTYMLERSTTMTLNSWTTVATQGPMASDAAVSLSDAAIPSDAAFYRIRVTGP